MPLDEGSSVPIRESKRSQDKIPSQNRNSRPQKSVSRNRAAAPSLVSPTASSSTISGGGLQFINLLGTEKHDVEGRNTVRSHARRHAWKNQRRGQDKKEVPIVPSGDKSAFVARRPNQALRTSSDVTFRDSEAYVDQCSKFREVARLLPQRAHSYPPTRGHNGSFSGPPTELARCTETALSIIHQPPITHPSITNSHSDPFNAFPTPLTPRLHHLIHYSRGIENGISDDTQNTFASHMGRSPSLVFATLAWTTSLSTSTQQPRTSESEYFLHKSITAINEDLSKVDQTGLSDGTIAAVACLSNMENLNGDKVKAQIHMNGLQQMIATRGGMKKLGMSGILRRLVLWADVLSATRWQTVPRFPLSEFPDLLSLLPLDHFRPHSSPKPFFAVINPTFTDLVERTGNQPLFHIMRETYELAHFLDNTPSNDPGLLERASFPDRIYIVEHKLLLLVSQNEGRQPRQSILVPLMHSLLLYIYTNIRLTPVDGKIRLTLTSRLQSYLQQADIAILNNNYPHELRWMHFLGGGAASKDTPERAWFVRSLVECGCRREWALWEHIVLGLKGFETAFLHRCEEYWNQVDETRKLEGHADGRHGDLCVVDIEPMMDDPVSR